MAFGGFFGGGSSSDKDNSSSSSSDSASPTITNPLSSSFASSTPSNSQTLSRIQSAITEQSNVSNAKQLISNVNTNCFEKCIPNPGGSLSGPEQKCLTSCMEKYIDAWNVTSRTYTARLQKESAALGGLGGVGAQAGGGKELF
ncbi:protein translocase subunit [Cladophialophora chaetospira]|uniref:Mitochondrial import inner membrane translocase subunit n=1 Tax=Cladophialophora chaetospira TaxID=386627 RepID=A0AA38X5M2_9EURO|nr:protein translocase subunit [Cladophialophora chaetospira]